MRYQFSEGECVRFTKNDYRRQFTNGETGTILSVVRSDNDIYFTVSCDSGRVVNFRQSDYCAEKGHLYLAQSYAMTMYASQDSTVDGDVFVY